MLKDCVLLPNKPRSRDGYLQISRGGRVYYAHRFYYIQKKGEIPVGFQLDHLCKNRACVNVDHLEPVAPKENVHRANMKHAFKQGRCQKGHALAVVGVYQHPTGGRMCRGCKYKKEVTV